MQFASMLDNPEMQALIKTAIVLTRFLKEAKERGSSHARIANNKEYLINSFGKIALETGLKIHTVSDMFKAKRSARIPTLVLVVDSLGKSMADFGKAYDKITDSDIQSFKEQHSLVKSSFRTQKNKLKNKSNSLKK